MRRRSRLVMGVTLEKADYAVDGAVFLSGAGGGGSSES